MCVCVCVYVRVLVSHSCLCCVAETALGDEVLSAEVLPERMHLLPLLSTFLVFAMDLLERLCSHAVLQSEGAISEEDATTPQPTHTDPAAAPPLQLPAILSDDQRVGLTSFVLLVGDVLALQHAILCSLPLTRSATPNPYGQAPSGINDPRNYLKAYSLPLTPVLLTASSSYANPFASCLENLLADPSTPSTSSSGPSAPSAASGASGACAPTQGNEMSAWLDCVPRSLIAVIRGVAAALEEKVDTWSIVQQVSSILLQSS